MDVLILSRLQFAFTASFHYLFPPMSIGLSWMIVIMEGMFMWTKKEKYRQITKFWTKIFALFFAMGVATGFVQVFAFGNNWSSFSKFVGNVFGTLLAAEGVFAFFLEAGFIGIMLFGWNRVKPATHYLATILVSIGATFSATWIVMANSWMQTPAGFKIIGEGPNMRAVITNLWDVYFNPSFVDRICHVLLGCGLLGVFLLMSISSFYILQKKHREFAEFTLKFSLVISFVFLSLQLISGDSSAKGVAENQPAKLAAMEALFETKAHAPFTLIGYVDAENKTVKGIAIPSLLSFLIYYDANEAVKGLNEFAESDWPNVPLVFYSYRTMVYSWCAMMLYSVVGLILWRLGNLKTQRWYLWLAVFSVFFPYLANIAGWFTAELGRQPWIVYNVMRTSDGVSTVLHADHVQRSILMFIVIYALLGSLFVFLLTRKIHEGLAEEGKETQYRDVWN